MHAVQGERVLGLEIREGVCGAWGAYVEGGDINAVISLKRIRQREICLENLNSSLPVSMKYTDQTRHEQKHKTLWANFLNAVYSRRGTTIGLTSDLINSGQLRTKNVF